ncbi:hypothetical protein KKF92_00100 [Patescibacteria group bacterium]|nr:hypothetical protein [Patescibacteria group bacterium]
MSYTKQLTEQIRVDIGKMLLAHEMIKLFPKLFDYDELKTQINDQWSNLNGEVAVRDFWNLIDSIMMGYKLKNITRDISSQYYSWNLVQTQVVGELKFSTDINGLASNTKTVSEVSAFLRANPTELKRITNGTSESFPGNNARHLDSIIILSQDSSLFVHDGNGRLLKAVVEGQETINAYIGTQNQSPKSNHWVPTSYLMRLADAKSKELLLTIFRESDNAISEFQDRVIVDDRFKREVLSEIGL